MKKEHKPTLADSIPNEDCYTIEDLMDDFQLSSQRTRQIIDKALNEKLVQRLIKVDGRRNLYAPQMVEQLKSAVESGKLGKFNRKRTGPSLSKASMVINVPIFDPSIAELLIKKFGSIEVVAKFAKTQLEESVKSILARQTEIKERYEKELQELMEHSTTFSPEVSL